MQLWTYSAFLRNAEKKKHLVACRRLHVGRKYKVDPIIIVTIAGIESNYGVHHSQFSVFNSLYTQIHEMPRRSKWASKELAQFLIYCF